MSRQVGLIGVGIMGSQIARKLTGAGYAVIARDIKPQAEESARGIGCTVAASPVEVARACEVILLSVPLPEDVEQIVLRAGDGILAAATPGSVIVDLSTVDAFSTRRNAERAAAQGVGYLDCPVLGRPQGCGKWTLPTGGEERWLDKARPILENVAARIVPVGPSGNGNVVKLLNNLMFGAINAITAEVFALSAKLGMPPKVLFATIADSGAATVSNLFRELGPKILGDDFSPLFSIDNLHKDMRLGIEMARKVGADFLVSETNQRLNTLAREAGFGAEDTAAAVKVCRRMLER
jgi:3-hydroxyisobutyrate dehydrogenase-like beta-hydroxyacid dehydrogenase